MAGVPQCPEIPVVLACRNVFVAVPQSLLMKESTVFRAQLNETCQNTDFNTPAKKRKTRSKDPEMKAGSNLSGIKICVPEF